MKTNVKCDFSKIPVKTDFTARVMLELETNQPKVETRAPLEVALVLDHSGSMDGEKLDHVKVAARNLISRLRDDDVFSLTIFDNRVETIIPPTPGSESEDELDKIDEIEVGGTTNLSGGYRRGGKYLRQNGSGYISRVILLTDGLANVGITSPDRLAEMAEKMRDRGITTSTFGVGMDYDEELLGKLAEAGGGCAYYIEKPKDAEEVFDEELKTLKTLAVTDCRVLFTPSKEVSGFAQMNTYAEIGRGVYIIGDVYSGVKKRLTLEVDIRARELPERFSAGTFLITYKDASGNKLVEKSIDLAVEMETVPEEIFAQVRPDAEVSVQAALCLGALAIKKARELALIRYFDEAAEFLDNAAETIARMNLLDSDVRRMQLDLRNRARRLREEKEEFFTMRQQKRMYHESFMVSKNMFDKFESMYSRLDDN